MGRVDVAAGQVAVDAKPMTVGHHVETLYVKHGVHTRVGAAVFAMQHRMLDP